MDGLSLGSRLSLEGNEKECSLGKAEENQDANILLGYLEGVMLAVALGSWDGHWLGSVDGLALG